MKLTFGIVINLLFFLISCNQISESQNSEFDWGSISDNMKDSLIYMANSERIPNSIEGVAAKEPRDYSKLVWILNNLKTEELEKLLYKHPSGEIKGIAIKGLIRRKSENLFEHFKYSISQNLNVRYYSTCQKLGGYFLREISHGVPSNLELYFSESEIEEINRLINQQSFKCD